MSRSEQSLEPLYRGQAPEDPGTLAAVTVGLGSLADFIDEKYLREYIPMGGSKIKFVTGRPGSGKTHLCRWLLDRAREEGYRTASFSAREVWLHDFRGVYLEILRQVDLEAVLRDCADRIISDLGYDPGAVPAGGRFMDLLAEKGEGDALAKGEIRGALRSFFTRNPMLDSGFAACCALLTGDILGHPVLEPASRALLYDYLHGVQGVKLSQVRALGLSPTGITRYNARHLLRSLTETVHLSGRPGLLVWIDDMETLLTRAADAPIRYTRLRREDTYESIRQLIDDIDSMRYCLFLLSFDRSLMDDENLGMKSYQALWMRIQNEVVSTRLNRFADIIDMDRYADECYPPQVLVQMSGRLRETLGLSRPPLTEPEAEEIVARGQYGGLGLPYLVNRAMLEGGSQND